MKRLFYLIVVFVMAVGAVQAQTPAPATVPAEMKAQDERAKTIVAKVLAIEDDTKAAELLVSEIRSAVQDEKNDFGKNGGPELTVAELIKTDKERALRILPFAFAGVTEGFPLGIFQRMVSASLLAAGDNAAVLTELILAALVNNSRYAEAVVAAARDTAGIVLPVALRQAVQAISATVLPPAVVPPGPPPPPPIPPVPPYEGQ